MNLSSFASGAVAFGLSLVLTPLCRTGAARLGFVARPKEDRWHRRPTPLLGGVAVTLATVVAVLPWMDGSAVLWPLMGCGVAIAAFGALDDIRSVKASTKLVAQIVVASAMLLFDARLHWTDSLAFDAMLTLFWIVGVTNAMNLLDNMDGLCAGVTVIAGGFMLASFWNQPVPAPVGSYLAALVGASAGFLVYNVHPASIFMGDAGSLFIGFNLAALTLFLRAATPRSTGLVSVVAAPVFLLLIPIFDTALVTVARLLSGRRPSQGGRDHSSHRLVAVGLSEPRAVTTLWALAAAGGAISLLLQRHDQGWAVIVLLAFALAMSIFAVYLARIRVYTEADRASAGGPLTPLVANFMHKRHVAEVLLDLCLIPLAYYTAYRLRFEGNQLAGNYPLFLQSLPIVLVSQLIALFALGGYRATWRYFGLMDAVVFGKGVVAGTLAAQLIILYAYRFESYSRTVFIIDGVLLFMLLGLTRGSFRLIGEFVLRRRAVGRRCAIYGTANGLATIQEAVRDAPLRIVGFIDDNALNRKMRVGGYSVLGGYETLRALIEVRALDCVILNTPLVDVERLAALEAACRNADVELLRLHVNLQPLSSVS